MSKDKQKRDALFFYINGYNDSNYWGLTFETLHPIGKYRLLKQFLKHYKQLK